MAGGDRDRRPSRTDVHPHLAIPPSGRDKGDNPPVADFEESQSPVGLLRSVPLFADLEQGELERFSRVAVPRAFPAATRVFHEGDHSDACYIVRSGSFRVTREHSDGRAITLASLGPGRHLRRAGDARRRGPFGQRRSAQRRRAAGAAGGRGPRPARAASGHHREAGRALVRRLRAANERISRQSFQTVPSRVAGVLSQLVAEESPAGDGGEVTIRMNQADLAQLAGTSRESVSRFLADLERAGIVQPGRGRVTVLAPAKLRNYIF